MNEPLAGRRIVNTRAAHQAGALDAALRARSAVPLAYPCIAIIPPQDTIPLDRALRDLAEGSFDWLVLTSVNTVFALAERCAALGLALSGNGLRTAAVGPSTLEAAQSQLGLKLMGLPAQYNAASLAAAVPVAAGERVLLPESTAADSALASMLAARGAKVTVVTAYQTVCGYGGVNIPDLLEQGQIDALSFTSPSTVTCFVQRLRCEGGRLETAQTLCAACIGGRTADTARDCGFALLAVPSEHTLKGLVEALGSHFAR